jgi:hypothetical protein
MIVKWLGVRWYFGQPEDEDEDVPARWVVFGLQVAAGVVAVMFLVKVMACDIAAADNPLIHYPDVEPSTPQVD